MADHVDRANDVVEVCTAEAERRTRDMLDPKAQPGFADFDGVNCVDCGDPIVPARLKLGRIRCLDCQETLEAKRARGLA